MYLLHFIGVNKADLQCALFLHDWNPTIVTSLFSMSKACFFLIICITCVTTNNPSRNWRGRRGDHRQLLLPSLLSKWPLLWSLLLQVRTNLQVLLVSWLGRHHCLLSRELSKSLLTYMVSTWTCVHFASTGYHSVVLVFISSIVIAFELKPINYYCYIG